MVSSFNSYMVRFKVLCKQQYTTNNNVSIPIWFDLKATDYSGLASVPGFQFLYGSI